jgi:hypothetical protein
MPAATPAAEPDDEPPGEREIVRIAGFRRLQKRELGRHRLAEHDAAGATRDRHQRCVRARPIAGIDRRAELGREVGGVENILHADRQPAQRLRREAGRLRLTLRARDVERHEGADVAFACGDRLGAEIDHGGRTEVARVDPAGEVERGQHQAVPSIRPTMRDVTARANGSAMNAVTDATGHPTR